MGELAGIGHQNGVILSWQNRCDDDASISDDDDACPFQSLPAPVFLQLGQRMAARTGIERDSELALRYGALQTVKFR